MKKNNKEKIVVACVLIFLAATIVLNSNIIYREFKTTLAFGWIRDYAEIKQKAFEVVRGCTTEECIFNRIESFIQKNITYVPEDILTDMLQLNNDPLNTLMNGNDCDGKAILAIDLLKALGKTDVYWIVQPNHICWAWRDYDNRLNLYNCDNSDILYLRKAV